MAYSPDERRVMLQVAQQALAHGLAYGAVLPVDVAGYAPALQALRACFVTLHRQERLRGCIGSLEACRPLVQDVAHNAYAAGFEDPRFSPLTSGELDASLHVHISVLSRPEPMEARSEAELLAQLRPGVDGLILEEPAGMWGRRRATFLPSVWEQLSDPGEFVAQLKRKAGLPSDYWSGTLRASRYTAESVE